MMSVLVWGLNMVRWEANGEARASSHDNTAKSGLVPVPLQIVTNRYKKKSAPFSREDA